MSERDLRLERLLDELGPVIDGEPDALGRHADVLAEDDDARDLRHDAADAAGALADAGADYVPPSDLEARVRAALDARVTAASSTLDAEGATPSEERPSEAEPPRKRAATPPPAVVGPGDTSGMGRTVKVVLGLGLAAAAALALVIGGPLGGRAPGGPEGDDAPDGEGPSIPATGTTARVVRIVRATDTAGVSGLEVQPLGGTWSAAPEGAALPAGAAVRTDPRTRVHLLLSDGSEMVLNHSTELRFDAVQPRRFAMPEGEVLADVAHLEGGPNLTVQAPAGRVEVLGTKFVLSATAEMANVRVLRGSVRLHGATGAPVEAKRGEEAVVHLGRAPTVSPVMDLARAVSWSELSNDVEHPSDTGAVPGLGSLRARRPGERQDRERPLALARHDVRVRIVGNVARTEIEEVFRNDSDTQLEGIYRFPLPSDAQIARLALDVDGALVEGSFVARERAARIWRGVIRNATPVSQRRPVEEFIWVPGPWRDPALLEWQRGGQFELRIFPIPAHGERRVVIAYTQVVPPRAEGRRYVYPLAHSADESTRVGEMHIDVRVAGASEVRASGYAMRTEPDADATRLEFAQADFRPNGDLMVDYRMSDGESNDPAPELSYWSYRGDAAQAPPENSRDRDVEVVQAQQALAADGRAYVMFAVRPRLPASLLGEAHDYVVVVDGSQSMVGERTQRAQRLVTGVLSELDRRDRFTVLVCDDGCRSMEGGAAEAQMRSPGMAEARAVGAWLASNEPAGATDLVMSLRAATLAAGRSDPSRRRHILYVGDGVASVGHRSTAVITAEAARLAEEAGVTITTVGIGADADAVTLAAIARAAGGHHVPFVPGQHPTLAALAVLETTYGITLREATLTLPEGLEDVAPARLPSVRAGEELVVTARMTGDEVRGEVVLRGRVGGEAFEQRYPVEIVPSTSAGNRFVPSQWASRAIADLELRGLGEDEAQIVAMSRAYSVMSRHTSLLVLESDAMFRAFGVDRVDATAQWTGEEAAEGAAAAGLVTGIEGEGEDEVGGAARDLDDAAATASLDGLGQGGGGGRAGGGAAATGASAGGFAGRATRREAWGDAEEAAAPRPSAAPATAPAAEAEAMPSRARAAASNGPSTDRASAMAIPPNRIMPRLPPPPPPRGQWMRRVYFRVGEIQLQGGPSFREQEEARRQDEALRLAPDSRDRHRAAVRALSRAGQLDRALEVAEAWFARDRQDPDALIARADLLARMGRRAEAVRLLRGIVDVRPDDAALQERLANAFDRAGDAPRACAHRVALAEIRSEDVTTLARAVRCERLEGESRLSDALLASVRSETVRQRAQQEASTAMGAPALRGELMIDASWSGGDDVDVALIAPDGSRLSWMGGRTTLVGRDARAAGHEQLGLRTASVGQYLVEVSRTTADERRPVHGQLRIRVLDETRVVPFTIVQGKGTGVARIAVRRESRLEAARDW